MNYQITNLTNENIDEKELKNVKKVLDKYISTLDFECSDERFTVKILMKI